jgi:hypothetical protein
MQDEARFDYSTIPNESLGKNELSRAGRGHHFGSVGGFIVARGIRPIDKDGP